MGRGSAADEGRDSYSSEVPGLTAPDARFSRVAAREIRMKKSRPADNQPRPDERKPSGAARTRAADLQPPATGANRGSPAAPVMKQFAKTKAESSGRS
jgi:hypothetical protein